MNKLSTEIIWGILAYLESASDFGSFRLVQRSFAPLAHEFLFSNIIIRNTKRSFSRLLKISRRPELAWHVKEVTLEIYSGANYLVWPEFIERLEQENIKHDDEAQGNNVAKIFRACVTAWYAFQKSSDYTAMLSTAFVCLSRLHTLTLRKGSELKLGLGLDISNTRRYPFRKRSKNDELLDISRGFAGLVNAAYIAATRIIAYNVLDIDDIYLRGDDLPERVAVIIYHCRTMKLQFNSFVPRLRMSSCSSKYPTLLGALYPSASVEQLHISFESSGISYSFHELFGDTLAYRWPRLKLLEIAFLYIYQEKFLTFLVQHKASLRQISICSCTLQAGSWAEIIKFMEGSLQLTSLKHDILQSEARKTSLLSG